VGRFRAAESSTRGSATACESMKPGAASSAASTDRWRQQPVHCFTEILDRDQVRQREGRHWASADSGIGATRAGDLDWSPQFLQGSPGVVLDRGCPAEPASSGNRCRRNKG
jgi:hypothetical protein